MGSVLIDGYNAVVPVMNKLVKEGYKVEAYHNKNEGYGFYIDLQDKMYIHCMIFYTQSIEYIVELSKHTSRYYHDVFDKELKSERTFDVDKVESMIKDLIDYSKTLEKTYKAEDITQTEVDYLKSLNNEIANSILGKLK